MSDFLAPKDVLPHRDSLLLLRRILELDQDHLAAIAMVGTDCALDRGGVVPTTLLVEMAAQAAAYHASVGAVQDGNEPAEKGFLVRLRKVEFEVETMDSGREVVVRVSRVGAMGGLAMYDFKCSLEQREVSQGSLSIMTG